MIRNCLSILSAAAIAFAVGGGSALAEETKIVGSSTVSAFAYIARDHMGAAGEEIVIEATGTGGGFSLFCKSLDPWFAPVALASRPINNAERRACRQNGVGDVQAYDLGLSGVIVAQRRRKKPVNLTLRDLFLGLAAKTPVRFAGACELVDNPHQNWNDIRAGLPDWPIEVYGPPLTSGTRSAFISLALKAGAMDVDCMRELHEDDREMFDMVVENLRNDGAWIDAGENDNVLLAAIKVMSKSFGVVGYPFYQRHIDELSAASISGVAPTAETIGGGAYPLSRVLRVYAKEEALERNPAARAFLDAITSPAAIGEGGYLGAAGLVLLQGGSPQNPVACHAGELCFSEQ